MKNMNRTGFFWKPSTFEHLSIAHLVCSGPVGCWSLPLPLTGPSPTSHQWEHWRGPAGCSGSVAGPTAPAEPREWVYWDW